jgi:hypothetical protein
MMPCDQMEFAVRGAGRSQCERIADALRAKIGQWVAMTDLWQASGAFAVHSRIADLRKRGLAIEHRNERASSGVTHSFYRLLA